MALTLIHCCPYASQNSSLPSSRLKLTWRCVTGFLFILDGKLVPRGTLEVNEVLTLVTVAKDVTNDVEVTFVTGTMGCEVEINVGPETVTVMTEVIGRVTVVEAITYNSSLE
jgi:hypothetical protein